MGKGDEISRRLSGSCLALSLPVLVALATSQEAPTGLARVLVAAQGSKQSRAWHVVPLGFLPLAVRPLHHGGKRMAGAWRGSGLGVPAGLARN